MPCHFNKATLYTTFNQCHCAENGSSPSSAASDLSWLSNYTASSASFSLLRDSVRMSRAQLAISDKHARQQTAPQPQPCFWRFVNYPVFICSDPPPIVSLRARAHPHTHSGVHTRSHMCVHSNTPSFYSLTFASIEKARIFQAGCISVTT